MDVFSRAKRSQVMSAVRSSGNVRTEMALIRIFRAHGICGWRRHYPLFGRPDFVFPRMRLAVFVDGCFWHACPKHGALPATNRPFWRKKLARNRARDLEVGRHLRGSGWKVVRIWQHDLRGGREAAVIRRIRAHAPSHAAGKADMLAPR